MPEKLSTGPRIGFDGRAGAGLSRGPGLQRKLTAAAWSNTWPAPGATLDLDFANDRGFVRGVGSGRSMDAVTFTRASNATFVGPDGLLKGSGSDRGALGVNLLTFPQDFDNAVWTKNSATVTPNAITAPDGTLTADKLVETAVNLEHRLFQSLTISAVPYTWSVYVKAAERSWAFIGCNNASALSVRTFFDLASGTVGTTPSGITASISNAGNGWYRCQITLTAPVASNFLSVGVASADNTHVYTGDGTSGIFIWGAQLETGSTATTYYPTNIGVPRFDWASTAVVAGNLLKFTDDFSSAFWTFASAAAVLSPDTNAAGVMYAINSLTDSTNSSTRYIGQTLSITANTRYRITFYAKAGGISLVRFFTRNDAQQRGATFNVSTGAVTATEGGATASIALVAGSVYRCELSWTSGTDVSILPAIQAGASVFGDGSTMFYLSAPDMRVLVGDEAVPPYAATGAITPTSIALLPATTCNGLLIEEARTNRLLWCRDATQTNWTKTNVTPAKDATGIDGVANAASSLTATAANGTCIQTITLASGSRTGSVYLKRITGTGAVQVSLDGTTWSTAELSSTEWRRIVLSGTVTNPVVGVRLAVSGDAVAMDYGQVEDGGSASTPILTTSASATRSGEISQILQQPLRSVFKADVSTSASEMSGTFFAEIVRGGYAVGTTLYDYLTLNNGGAATSYALIANRADNLGGAANNPFGLSMAAYVPQKVAVAFDIRSTQEESAIGGVVTGDKTLNRVSTAAYDRLAILNSGRTSSTVVPQGYIKRLAYFPQVIVASALEALTR